MLSSYIWYLVVALCYYYTSKVICSTSNDPLKESLLVNFSTEEYPSKSPSLVQKKSTSRHRSLSPPGSRGHYMQESPKLLVQKSSGIHDSKTNLSKVGRSQSPPPSLLVFSAIPIVSKYPVGCHIEFLKRKNRPNDSRTTMTRSKSFKNLTKLPDDDGKVRISGSDEDSNNKDLDNDSEIEQLLRKSALREPLLPKQFRLEGNEEIQQTLQVTEITNKSHDVNEEALTSNDLCATFSTPKSFEQVQEKPKKQKRNSNSKRTTLTPVGQLPANFQTILLVGGELIRLGEKNS